MVPVSRTTRALLAGIALLAAARLGAQRATPRPSEYIPLDDPATATIDALVARGAFPSLSALERPYRAGDVLRALEPALAGDLTADAGRVRLRWLRSVLRAACRYDPAPCERGDSTALRASVSLTPYVTAQTTGRRELMLADSVGRGTYPGADLRVSLAGPSFVGVSRLRLDRSLHADPEFAGKSDRSVVARMEEAYLAARWRWVSLDAGRVARNWGPAPLDGLQLGHYADSWDHVQLVLGADALHLTTIAARLDDVRVATDTVAQRYLTLHRLAGRWRLLEVAATEAIVYGGPARGFDPGLTNPLALLNLAQYDEKKSLNASYGLDVALRTRTRGLWSGQLLVDDFQLDRCGAVCREPASLGGTVSVEALPLPATHAAAGFASWTRLNNLTYRTLSGWERYASLGLSLGRGQVDYEEARAGVELDPPSGGPLRLYAALRRQGEGDYRKRFPAVADYPTTPTIFAGVVERVTRAAAQWSSGERIGFSADVGWERAVNADHVAGRTRSGVVGRVKLSLRPALAIERRIAE